MPRFATFRVALPDTRGFTRAGWIRRHVKPKIEHV
jgi:hypothetical protein